MQTTATDQAGADGLAWTDARLGQALLNALPVNAALLNKDGVIIAVNQSWQKLAETTTAGNFSRVGVSFLVTGPEAAGPFCDQAKTIAAGIRAVLNGSTRRFALEYPWRTSNSERWFQMEVTFVPDVGSPTALVMHHDISERKRTDESCQAGEQQIQQFLDSLPVPAYTCNATGQITYSNTKAKALGGRAPKLHHPEDCCCDVLGDIADRKTAEEATNLSRTLVEEANDGIEVIDKRLRQQEAVAQLGLFALSTSSLRNLLDKTVATVSRVLDAEFCKVLELQPDHNSLRLSAGVGWTDGLVGTAVVPAGRDSQAGYTLFTDGPVIVADLPSESRFAGPALLTEHGVVSGVSVVIRCGSGPFGVLGVHTRQRRAFSTDDVNFVQCVANVLADFIERRRIESQFRLLVQSVEDYAILMLDPEGVVTTWNRGAEKMSGFKAEEVIGHRLDRFYLPEEAAGGEPLRELMAAAAAGKATNEGWRNRKDGSRFLAKSFTVALHDEGGELKGFSRVVQDVTAQRREEESLRSVVVHSVDAIFTIDEQGIVQSCGGAVTRIFGYTLDECIGRNITILMPEPHRTEHRQSLCRYLDTGETKIIGKVREVRGLRKDGSEIPVEIAVTEFTLNGTRYFTGLIRDVSARKELEEQLRQSQKMEAFGQLAGGVAHDFNNLLTIILGYSELLLAQQSADDPKRKLVEAVKQAGERASSLTSQLLAFGRRQILELKELDLNAIVGDTEKMLRRLIGEDIQLSTLLDANLSPVKADPGQIVQVIINLAVNARDAMPEGGNLTIETADVDLDSRYAKTHPDVPMGRYVRLAITDTGDGMTPEVKSHIFEPFFTTKGVGKGTGLGLAVVHGIVQQSGGCIDVDSEVGLGTTFKIYLPAMPDRPTSLPTQDAMSAVRGTETILLVEDEDAVRNFSTFVLRAQGYTVERASSGSEALRLLEGRTGAVDLLVTDVVMPEMSGRKLAEVLRSRFAQLKVLFISGYTDDTVMRHGITYDKVAFLQKPFTASALAKKVREVLDQK